MIINRCIAKTNEEQLTECHSAFGSRSMIANGNQFLLCINYRNRVGKCVTAVALLALCVLPNQVAANEDTNDAILRIDTVVDFGKDIGQNFGSLFEARDNKGRLVFGAGFAGVYNTVFRNDRNVVQFFIRPEIDDQEIPIERLPRPGSDSGVYMFDLDGKLHARSHGFDKTVRSWNAPMKRWDDENDFDGVNMRGGDGRIRVAGKVLHFGNSSATYDGKILLTPPSLGFYHHFYYASGHLIFYHRNDGNVGFSKLHACPWTPETNLPIEIAKARTLDLSILGETPFVFGQLGPRVLTCSNFGGVYVFDGAQWKTLRPPDRKVSFQIYSSVNYYDRLLLGQYPTGFLFEFDGESLKLWNGAPPVIPGVSKSAREAQTAMIYRGELFAGVWPWAELWRYDRDPQRWFSIGRLFTHPNISDKFTHPYEQETKSLNTTTGSTDVLNRWGQRVTSLVPLGDSLMISTSSKGPEKKDSRPGFINDEKWQEYGQVSRLRLKGNLAATIKWKEQQTRLQFIVTRNAMKIRQDGKELASAKVDPAMADLIKSANITWGKGVFGPFQGKIQGSRANK